MLQGGGVERKGGGGGWWRRRYWKCHTCVAALFSHPAVPHLPTPPLQKTLDNLECAYLKHFKPFLTTTNLKLSNFDKQKLWTWFEKERKNNLDCIQSWLIKKFINFGCLPWILTSRTRQNTFILNKELDNITDRHWDLDWLLLSCICSTIFSSFCRTGFQIFLDRGEVDVFPRAALVNIYNILACCLEMCGGIIGSADKHLKEGNVKKQRLSQLRVSVHSWRVLQKQGGSVVEWLRYRTFIDCKTVVFGRREAP